MTQSFWESETVEDQQAEPEAEAELTPEMDTEPEEPHPAPAGETLALSVDDFSALEERILRTVSLVKREREARTLAEARAEQAEAELRERGPVVDQLQKEVSTMRAEREHVRQRVERLLEQLDGLEL
jgi:hypothetical protein